MQALKNDSTIYTQVIASAIHECYEKNSEPTNTELMELYSFVGQCICEQGEKAVAVHLAQTLAEQLPQIKGFSPRNLRRMRDFYHSYENRPELMRKALTLSWTQNTVILDSCETDGQRAFYMTLAIEQSLSKLALMKAIEEDTFATSLSADTAQATVATVRPAVTDCTSEQGVDTTTAKEQPCGALVTACEPLRQGGGVSIGKSNIIATVIVAVAKIGQSKYEPDAGQASLPMIYAYQAPPLRFLTPIDRGNPPHDNPRIKKEKHPSRRKNAQRNRAANAAPDTKSCITKFEHGRINPCAEFLCCR